MFGSADVAPGGYSHQNEAEDYRVKEMRLAMRRFFGGNLAIGIGAGKPG
jgi:hypothetical protein